MDVLKKGPGFSIERVGTREYVFKTSVVSKGVIAQVVEFIRSLRGKFEIEGSRVSKRAAIRMVPQLLKRFKKVRVKLV